MPLQIHSSSGISGTEPSTHRLSISNVYPSDPFQLLFLQAELFWLLFSLFIFPTLKEKKMNVKGTEPQYQVLGHIYISRQIDSLMLKFLYSVCSLFQIREITFHFQQQYRAYMTCHTCQGIQCLTAPSKQQSQYIRPFIKHVII